MGNRKNIWIFFRIFALIFVVTTPLLFLCGGGGGETPPSNIAGIVVYHPPTNEIKYSYYHYIPTSALQRNPVRVLLYGHGSPKLDTYSQMEEYVRTSEIPRIKSYCDTYGYALVIMVTPRSFGPYPDYKMNTQSMARWVMFNNRFDKSKYKFYKRPDLLFIKVIDDFMNFLSSNGYTPYPKVFMTGFSNGGMQSNRFPILHPGKVAATAIGAAGAFLYPVEIWSGITLTYPVGTSDIGKIPGSTYSLAAFKQIPHFIFVGENDLNYNNDPVNFDDNYDRDQATIINTYFGSNAVERARNFADYLNLINMQSTAKVYPGVGHNYTSQMLVETFNFFDSVSTQ